MITKIWQGYQRWRDFILRDMWVRDVDRLPPWHRSALNSLKMVYIVVRGFISDKCALQAAALTFITLMAIVPVMALALSITKGLHFDENLRWTILNYTQEHFPEQIQQFVNTILEIMDQANFVAIGSIGSIFILATLIGALHRIELTMNQIWGIRGNRKPHRKLAGYFFVMIVVPALFVLATSINAGLASNTITDFLQNALYRILPKQSFSIHVQSNFHLWYLYYLGYYLIMRSVGTLCIIGALSFLYMFMPNTRVKFRSALIGGLVAGILWLLWQHFCINFQFWVTKYNALYGAFASLPVALFWLNINWMIILFGVQVSFADQNYKTYVLEQEAHTVSYALRRRLAFEIVYEICKAFHFRNGPWKPDSFQIRRHVPVRLLHEIMDLLKSHEVVMKSPEGGWVPTREIKEISMKDVEMAVSGRLAGKFAHLAQLPDELVPIFEAQHMNYLEQLGNRTYGEMVELAPKPGPPGSITIDNLKNEDTHGSGNAV